jgi:TfoX N-terminal domain
MTVDQAVVDRVRDVLQPLAAAGGADCEEKRMFGSLCFMVSGSMCCCVSKEGLLVRVGRDGMDEALAEANVEPMQMRGRRMSGFVIVAPEGFATASQLRKWVVRGMSAAKAASSSPS